MELAIREQVFPGGVLLVSEKGKTVFHKAFGKANIYSGLPVVKNTVFDLASLTKPLATTLAVMKLVEENILSLSDTLGKNLPGYKGTSKEKITIRQLLDHTSGFPDYRPFYKELMKIPPEKRRTALKGLLLREALINIPGTKTLYSDLGFMVLGWIVETASGDSLNSFIEKRIYSHIGLDSLFFIALHGSGSELKIRKREFAATEQCQWREKLIEGAVHDDNAFATGGVEGHAGLFGTAGDVNRLLEDLLLTFYGKNSSGVFNSHILSIFLKRPGREDGRVLGFDIPSPQESSCGKYFSAGTVGHLGFSGTSFWMDLERSITVILLTNRIHPSRNNEKIKAFRPRLHDAVMQQLASAESIKPNSFI